jgi:hypothetical protein
MIGAHEIDYNGESRTVMVNVPDFLYWHDNGQPRLSVIGRGYADGFAQAKLKLEKNPTVLTVPGDSDTRRAYVFGYHEGYDAAIGLSNLHKEGRA